MQIRVFPLLFRGSTFGTFEKCIFLLGMLFSMAVVPGVCRAETVVIPVHYRSVDEVLPIVKGILSPTGQVTFADSVHSLVVTDTAASIQQAGNEVLSAIIGSSSGKEHSSLSMLLMVETFNR